MQATPNINFIGSVHKTLLMRVKVTAAKNDTSINALFNAELRYLVETFDAAEKSGNQNYKSLLDFSLGNAGEVSTLGKLGIGQTEDLFLLMAQARLPMPRMHDAVTQCAGHDRKTALGAFCLLMSSASEVVLLPDAGSPITLAYADVLDVLFKLGCRVALLDMVPHEVTRNQTPTSDKLSKWVKRHQLTILPTQTYAQYRQEITQPGVSPLRKDNLGKLAVQETINQFALQQPPQTAVFLFEDHRIAKLSFVWLEFCQKISTRAFLMFLEQKGWIASASAIERPAIQAGWTFSQLRFTPD